MICKHCGAQIAEGSNFCEYCGSRVEREALPDEHAGGSAQANEAAHQGYTATHPAASAYVNGVRQQAAEPPMKWHKFLVYFGLWFGALSNLLNGFSQLNGTQYDGEAAAVYERFALLQTLDKIFGVLVIALAAFGFYTAYCLLVKKKGAPKLLYIMYAANIVITLGYNIAAYAVLKSGGPIVDASAVLTTGIVGAVFGGIMLMVNMIYYKKREHLFVN